MFYSFSHVMLYVRDTESTANWYIEKLGFQPNFITPHYASLRLEQLGFRLDLHPVVQSTDPDTEIGHGPIAYFRVVDINHTVDALKQKAIRVEEPRKQGNTSFASFWDCEGNVLGLVEE
jgi:catechol 2,3-dioxygenase-like lactoylglutathione lyase family enzyme